jgi:hypothetical protein
MWDTQTEMQTVRQTADRRDEMRGAFVISQTRLEMIKSYYYLTDFVHDSAVPDTPVFYTSDIQGVPGGICQTSGRCSLC